MPLARLFEPLRVGRMALPNRIHVPAHGAGAGRILGSERDAEVFIAYYARRARGGAGWIGGSSTWVRTPLIPGFEPTGIGAVRRGSYRHPRFVERHRRYVDAIHAEGAVATFQMIAQGGLPHGASEEPSGEVALDVPHALSRAELAAVVAEYGFSAAQAAETGVDGLELHANHDDVLQHFLSPRTNRRADEYGADRLRLLLEVVAAIRAAAPDLTLGARLCLDEQVAGGYDAAEGLELARRLDGVLDFLHVDVGSNWGAPSYVPPLQYDPADWVALAAAVRDAVGVPVVYTGRLTDAERAAAVLDRGAADVVGMTRAVIADPDLPRKARAGDRDVRPCVGGNDCLHRTLVDGMSFSCAVNPQAGYETAAVEPAAAPRRVLVVGGGPAGMEAAALAAERGHDVTLWERDDALGGQLAIAARAPHHDVFGRYVDAQARRLERAGVAVELRRDADPDAVLSGGFGAVVVATGARARVPSHVDGLDSGRGAARVVQIRDVLRDRAPVGERVLLFAGEDHAAPLLGAAHLAERGHHVRLVHPQPTVAPLVGRYSLGGYLAPLHRHGVEFLAHHRLVAAGDTVRTADVYAGVERVHDDVDTVVLACGGAARDGLFHALRDRHPEVHLVGDAWAPRRLTIATRQAWELARAL